MANDRRRIAWRRYAAVFAVALLCRTGWGALRDVRQTDPSLLFPDEVQYWDMSRSFRAGDGLRDELGFRATRMPLYPAFLSLFPDAARGQRFARIAQWLIGALGAVAAMGLAGCLFDHRVALYAGLAVAVDPFLVFFSSLLLTETLFVAAITAFWWLLARAWLREWSSARGWVIAGLIGAACVYLRESSVGLMAVAMCFLVLIARTKRRVLAGAAIIAILVGVSLVPWAVRNERWLNTRCWLTTRAGISLYDGVRPGATGASDLGGVKEMPAVRGLDEPAWNRYFLSASWSAIKRDPARIAGLAVRKLARMWNPFPNVETHRTAAIRALSVAWTLPIFALALGGAVLLPTRMARVDGRTIGFLLLPAIYLSLIHTLFVGSVRYRLGAMPMLEILAAATALALIDRMLSRRRAKEAVVEP